MLIKNKQENIIGAQLAPVEVSFNRRQTHALAKPTKLIAKELEYLVERLLALTRSENDKVAKDACTDLLKHHKDCVEAQEKDSIVRALLQVKHGNGSRDLEDSDNMPLINFNEIQNID